MRADPTGADVEEEGEEEAVGVDEGDGEDEDESEDEDEKDESEDEDDGEDEDEAAGALASARTVGSVCSATIANRIHAGRKAFGSIGSAPSSENARSRQLRVGGGDVDLPSLSRLWDEVEHTPSASARWRIL